MILKIRDEIMSIIVLIGGGHASGKTTAADLLKIEVTKTFPELSVKLIDMDNYLIPGMINESRYSSSKSTAITVSNEVFQPLKPSRFDFKQLKDDLTQDETQLVIVHGLYALYDKEIRDLSKFKIFISSDADTRLIRWIRRDVTSGNCSLETVINKYLQGARAEMNDFINPTKEFSDVIMPTGAEANAVGLIVDGISPYVGKQSHYSVPVYHEEKKSFYELN